MKIISLQTNLAARGLYTDRIDGTWGRNSEAAHQAPLALVDELETAK